ncbi:helix-turn-helix domain-containing protein [Floricoccus penangensis]|nr:helix-turn-helix domain-containing protein [Floricoccus penangensis]
MLKGELHEYSEQIVDLIIKEKDKQNLSLSELARRTGLAKSTLSRYFNKTREFPLNRASDFAKSLNVPTEYLLGLKVNH